MPPQPVVFPHLCEAQRAQTLKHRLEVVHDVLRSLVVWRQSEAAIEKSARAQGCCDLIDRSHRIDKVLPYVHGSYKIESSMGKLAFFQVDHFRRQTTTLETPLAEPQQGRTDIGRSDLQPMPGEENASRADPGAEVHVASAAVLLGKAQGD